MAGKETARPFSTMSGGSCSIGDGTSSAATGLDKSGVPAETREVAWQQRENQAANRIQECHVCRFAFTNTAAFQKHTADHSLGKKHNCSECGKLFVSASKLTRHLVVHGGHGMEAFENHAHDPSLGKTHNCSDCGKQFQRPWDLARHLRMHGEPSFECGVCGKTFYTKDGHETHMSLFHVGAQD
ncbi:uncharacterized protein LOC142559581 [Dermacentor variabilis]|uniref:uncharacterized protein LOC142559581 n=1 Tax=Dermacentor variabilis TaxID=34621 RepID=UPI003F5BBD7A